MVKIKDFYMQLAIHPEFRDVDAGKLRWMYVTPEKIIVVHPDVAPHWYVEGRLEVVTFDAGESPCDSLQKGE